MTHATELVSDAIDHCERLTSLLHEENELLRDRQVEQIEEKIKEKRHLAAKVEKLVALVKTCIEDIKTDQQATQKLPSLQACIDNYQITARKNIMLLQSAHATTSDFINLVRRAVDLKKPNVKTYGKTGQIKQDNHKTTLVNKDI